MSELRKLRGQLTQRNKDKETRIPDLEGALKAKKAELTAIEQTSQSTKTEAEAEAEAEPKAEPKTKAQSTKAKE